METQSPEELHQHQKKHKNHKKKRNETPEERKLRKKLKKEQHKKLQNMKQSNTQQDDVDKSISKHHKHQTTKKKHKQQHDESTEDKHDTSSTENTKRKKTSKKTTKVQEVKEHEQQQIPPSAKLSTPSTPSTPLKATKPAKASTPKNTTERTSKHNAFNTFDVSDASDNLVPRQTEATDATKTQKASELQIATLQQPVLSLQKSKSVKSVIEYSKDPAKVAERVEQFLSNYLTATDKKPQELYCVFDVDETLLFTDEENDTISVHPLGRVVYDMCRDMQFKICIITARVGDQASFKYLQQQLEVLEYRNYHKVFMVSDEHKNDDSPAECKYQSRLELESLVLLNVGNQLTDFFCVDPESDSVLSTLGHNTYYFLQGQSPDVLCLKLPTNDR